MLFVALKILRALSEHLALKTLAHASHVFDSAGLSWVGVRLAANKAELRIHRGWQHVLDIRAPQQ